MAYFFVVKIWQTFETRTVTEHNISSLIWFSQQSFIENNLPRFSMCYYCVPPNQSEERKTLQITFGISFQQWIKKHKKIKFAIENDGCFSEKSFCHWYYYCNGNQKIFEIVLVLHRESNYGSIRLICSNHTWQFILTSAIDTRLIFPSVNTIIPFSISAWSKMEFIQWLTYSVHIV